ncbi:MAG: acyl-CoA thioesterase [Polyangiales bacterium]|nr:acyl-CoA thioesterase [Myxococcales bacterium]MCB9661303.1 acyl-CoA thioesterase [Sandaracinaceae bacterium]
MLQSPLPVPDVPEAQRTRAAFPLRYADVDQTGALKFTALPLALERCGWDHVMQPGAPMERLAREHGTLAILTRFRMRCGTGPISVSDPVEGHGAFTWSHTADDNDTANRILFTIFASLSGKVGHTHGEPPPNAGDPVALGAVEAEHVFTRPFGAPKDRRVMSLPEGCGLPSVPGPRATWRVPARLVIPPDDARRLDREPRLARRVLFGLTHTDSNRHVNSLVYPALFEEMALERLHDLGVATGDLQLRDLEIAYRKPCFAGERVEVMVQALRSGERFGAVGSFVPLDREDRRPSCYVQVWF